jgi:hypothetical protein
MPGLEDGQRRGATIPCEGPGASHIRKGNGGPQKPFSSLSEEVRGGFTIDTETDETACVLHLKIPNVPTCRRDTVKREVREEQEKNMDTLLYGLMDEMRRKQMLIQRFEG